MPNPNPNPNPKLFTAAIKRIVRKVIKYFLFLKIEIMFKKSVFCVVVAIACGCVACLNCGGVACLNTLSALNKSGFVACLLNMSVDIILFILEYCLSGKEMYLVW